MRSLIEIITTVTGSIRFIVGAFVLCIFGLGLIFTVGAGVVAPQAVEKVAESAERAHDKEIAAAREAARNRSYAAQGWGYESDSPVQTSDDIEVEEDGEVVGGWGE